MGLIDWHSTELCPLYFQAGRPPFIDYDGPHPYGLERPRAPKYTEQPDANAKKQAEAFYWQQSLCSLYNTLTYYRNPRLYAALEFQRTTSFVLLLLARRLLVDGEAAYLLQIAELEATWSKIPSAKNSAYPFSFSTEERRELEADVEGWVRGMDAMSSIKENIDELLTEQPGTVRVECYEEALDALEQLKGQVIEEFASSEQDKEVWLKEWPFGT